MTPLLLGVDIPTVAGLGSDPSADARRAEDLGFDFVSANDHPEGGHPTHETWTMLTWIAAATTSITVASRVLGVPYRSPAMVAKMAATLDGLSGGRLILGLGGGYSDDEFRAFGLRVPTPKEKVEGLEEAIRIARGLWSEPGFTFEGRHFHVAGAELEPKPSRRIPIWVGTYGPRALAVTGRVADGWIPSFDLAPPERVPEMRDRIFAAARGVGRDPEEITFAYNIEVQIGAGGTPNPGIVSGSSEAVAERLASLLPLGVGAINLKPVGPDRSGQVEQLGLEVLPALRAL
ncbi:MAG TPA: LLM class flavin-dependent oxidoreductase [Actinomycetota bacterium]|jgi:alkanesulfonate monooxygenase SsuD/methylene tetrahydromethanopterin reductase-like flavin-dependent oxidoreductase (luciferase family)|nr:LLM class flavin-dependent oxidoreductase [Actinomycetota bacterium]